MIPEDLHKAVHGDMNAFLIVLTQPHETLHQCRNALSGLVVTPDTLRKLLIEIQEHRIDLGILQKWASFVRWGFIAGATKGPISAIDIDYDSSAEELIADIVARLSEIGDEIDGTITDEEIIKWLDLLPK
jgi:hypothetical protein